MLSVNVSDTVIISVKEVGYHCIIYGISKSEAISLLENSLLEIVGIYKMYTK